MPIEIIVPRLGWSMEEGALVAWLKKDGEFVHAGEPLLSIEGDKAVQEIESIDSGILRIAVNGPKPGDSIRVGEVLGHLLSADEAASESAPATLTTNRDTPSLLPSLRLGGEEQVPEGPVMGRIIGSTVVPNPAQPRSTPAISPRALRVAAELGVDWTTVIGTGRAGRIRERDIRGAAMRDGGFNHGLRDDPDGTGMPSAKSRRDDRK